jgi:hypothetical protein
MYNRTIYQNSQYMVMTTHKSLQMQEPSVHQTEFVNCSQDVTKVSCVFREYAEEQ